MITCQCPPPTALPDIPCVECPERFGQIQKVAFQRLTADDGTKNGFPKSGGTDTITDLANWQSAMTAADSTKIVISPYIYSPTQETGAPRTFGGGNDSLGGVEEIIGRELTSFSASVRNLPQSVVSALKKMQCEGSLGVYLFDQYGNVECIVDEDGNAYPIPIKSFFVGDKVHGGIDAPDTNVIQWSFVNNYSDDLHIFDLESFNPLTDFCAGASPSPKKSSINVFTFHSLVPTTAVRIFFSKSGSSTAGFEQIGYVDDEHAISVWRDVNAYGYYKLISDNIICPPKNSMYFFNNYDCERIEFHNFDTSDVEYMDSMFYNCRNLQTIYTYNDWVSLPSSPVMFYGCVSLVGGNGTAYNVNHINQEYAKIDRIGTPGYFTLIPT